MAGGRTCFDKKRSSTMSPTRDFKQLVRARMEQTGERYTAARAVLLQKAAREQQPALPLELPAASQPEDFPSITQVQAALMDKDDQKALWERPKSMAELISEGARKVPQAEPRVYAWEINEATFCELKLALDELKGDVRTPERERGRRARSALDSAIDELPLQPIGDFAEIGDRHEEGGIGIFSNLWMESHEHGLEGQAQLVVWDDELELFQLKTLRSTETPPRVQFRRLNTGAFESDAAQALAYGLLLEARFGISPRLWVIYAHEEFVARVTAMASSPASDASTLLQTLRDAKPMEVPFTPHSREYIIGGLERIRRIKLHPEAARRSHSRVGRCNGCAQREQCPERLIDAGMQQ